MSDGEKRVAQEDRLPQEWQKSAYERWLEAEGIPVLSGYDVQDLARVGVAPWPRMAARGAYIRLAGTEDTNNAYIIEVPPGGQTAEERHLYEEFYFVVDGRGACEVRNQAGGRQAFEWQPGSLFSIPLNCAHRLHNGSGTHPARLLGVTTAPVMLNLIHNTEFLFNCPFDFLDRFDGRAGYFGGEGTLYPGRVWDTNFVADVRRFQLHDWAERGAGGKNVMFEFANNALCAHVSEFPVGTYKKAHRHGPGAHVIILSGEGYSIMWPEGAPAFTEVPWRPGTMFVPPGMWWHQHFNTGPTPARYLAIRWGGAKWKVARYLDIQGVDKSRKDGGNQIEYEDQDPRVHRMFVERSAARGVPVRMDAFRVRV
ncbi:MAG: cupin domain-containing protein [Bacillati bacterium ANGP1]|uniref:Cupin domain-containing protein n=1 Tax=Candidatus Segetimicrobium genomatis TaxID=2569760 RepID=A0A537JG41_9BACT|nr:MAG: cupin domain-containing protein [Terrabacteria group bacterium ANGP1]